MPQLPEKPPKPDNLEEAIELIDDLWEQLQKHQRKTNRNSKNSSQPPSKDSLDNKPAPSKASGSTRQRGAQKGHKGHRRSLVSEDQVDQTSKHYAPYVCECGGDVLHHQGVSYRHQVYDFPKEIRLHIHEHQLIHGECQCCGKQVKAQLPEQVSPTQKGPNLLAFISLLSGQYHLSLNKIRSLLNDVFGTTFSKGSLSEAQGQLSPMLTVNHQHIRQQLSKAAYLHADETSHYRNGEQRWMWLMCNPSYAYFMINYSRAQQAAKRLLGETVSAYVVTDQYVGYQWLPDKQRQLCWAHLLRNMTAIAEADGHTGWVGKRLLLITLLVFRTRHRWEQKSLSEAYYHRRMQKLKQRFNAYLKKGTTSPSQYYVGRCEHLLKMEQSCWTFLDNEEIPLTNNEAERRLRSYVIWRKVSYGVWSHRGELFRQRILSLMETCRLQGVSPFTALKQITHAVIHRLPYPDVFESAST
jgi:hypothetical protein